MKIITMISGIVATYNLFLKQLDVKTTFLYSDLEEDIYIHQQQRFHNVGKEESSMQAEKDFIWSRASSKTMVQDV
jgi:hypothetical protein